MKKKPNTIEIKPYNIKELCTIYGVAYRTMVQWIDAHKEAVGARVGRYYTALQVEIIFEKLGLPSQIDEEE